MNYTEYDYKNLYIKEVNADGGRSIVIKKNSNNLAYVSVTVGNNGLVTVWSNDFSPFICNTDEFNQVMELLQNFVKEKGERSE